MWGGQGGGMTFGMAKDLEPLATIHIVMDTAKECSEWFKRIEGHC